MEESTTKTHNQNCKNCAHPISEADQYCSNCGQKNTDGRISIGEFFAVAFSTIFNLESKFFKTIRDIFSPGKLTNEWFKGKHKPYFHPVRLFIVTALLLIAAISPFIAENNTFMNGDSKNVQKEIYRKDFIKEIGNFSALYIKDEKAKTVLDSLANTMRKGNVHSGRQTITDYGKKKDSPDFSDSPLEEIVDYYENEFGPKLIDSLINVVKSQRRLVKDSVQVVNLVGNELKQNISNEDFLDLTPTEIADKYQIEGSFKRLHFKQRVRLQKSEKDLLPFILANSLWVALLMMPFFAIILKLFYIRHDYYYLEHLIFSFHAHSFAFILFTIILLFIRNVYFHPVIIFFGFFLLFVYLYKSLENIYQQGRWKTLSKLLVANIIYLGLFFAFAMMGMILSLFLF